MFKKLPALLLAAGMLLAPTVASAREHERHHRHARVYFGVGVGPRGGYYDRWGYWHP